MQTTPDSPSPFTQKLPFYQNLRMIWAAIAITSFAAMGYAFYAEHILELKPCNLCMLQRGSMTLLGGIALIAFLQNSEKKSARFIYVALADLAALSGVILAGRHVWLQHLPEYQVPACGPDFDFLINQFPLIEVITEIFQGSGQCAEIQWQFLGLSMPEVLLGLFIGLWSLCHYALFLIIKEIKKQKTQENIS